MLRLRYFVPVLILFFLGYVSEIKSQEGNTEANVKAVLVYKFTKFLHWPENADRDTFKIGVLGDAEIASALKIITHEQLIKKKPAKIEELNPSTPLKSYNIIFLSQKSTMDIKNVLQKIQGEPVLLIGDKEGFGEKGAGINLIKQDGKIKFEINLSSLRENGIESNTQFINLASVLYD
ncbi:MAG: YfiR family protein [Melioribacteraceae bacterium]|nr:YfiR family protein [Melioribacteraceae bacterium]MCF8266191.1 YfiR family protein [Melioribacteraceae bacterium]MCF8431882.1 YfiR family protein [Melioribacteraceae bacterium]